jgi:hypothetical protein
MKWRQRFQKNDKDLVRELVRNFSIGPNSKPNWKMVALWSGVVVLATVLYWMVRSASR